MTRSYGGHVLCVDKALTFHVAYHRFTLRISQRMTLGLQAGSHMMASQTYNSSSPCSTPTYVPHYSLSTVNPASTRSSSVRQTDMASSNSLLVGEDKGERLQRIRLLGIAN